ncbi:MAG: hypothetical protein AABX72_03715 [Nanoarchaeota archaeon]
MTNRLLDKYGLRVLKIVPAYFDESSELVEIDGDLTTYKFPANCVVEVFLGTAEPEPFATYVAQVIKA